MNKLRIIYKLRSIGIFSLVLLLFFILFTTDSFAAKPNDCNVLYNGLSGTDHHTYIDFIDNNSGTSWEVKARYFGFRFSTNFNYFWTDTGGLGNSDLYINCYRVRPADTVKWLTACVDPVEPININPSTPGCGGTGKCIYIWQDNVNASCKVGNGGVYKACTSAANNAGNVDFSDQCPSNGPWCGTEGHIWQCDDTCGGPNNCTRTNRSCPGKNSGAGRDSCNIGTVTTYAAACDNGTNGRCAPPPPGNRTDSAFCQGPASANRAAGINMNWDAIPFPSNNNNTYDIELRQVGGGDLHTWSGDATQYSFPGSGCTTGPGGCSLPYNTNYEWRVRGHTSSGHSGPTDWSGWNTRTTNNCVAQTKDLIVSAFTYPGGTRGTTTNPTVSITNTGNQAITNNFVVRVCNGDGGCRRHTVGQTVSGGETVILNSASASEFRNMPLPSPARGYTATATVDVDGDIPEDKEGNNDRTYDYTTTNPNCNSGIVCGPCSVVCGTGTKTCTYTTYTGGGACNQVPAPNQTCTPTCSTGTCVANTCVSQSDITGKVWVDSNNSGVQDAGESNYTGLTVTMSGANSGTRTTNATGNYAFNNQLPGGYTISIPTIIAGYVVPVTQKSVTLPPSAYLEFRLVPVGWFNPKGNHDAASCTVTTGWTCDPDNFAQGINVNLYRDGPAGSGTFMGAATANLAAGAAVGAQCGGNANHGFSFNMPVSIYDGVSHPIYAYAVNIGNGNSNPLLTSSPRTVTCARSIVNIHVYNDNNGNGAEDAGETGSSSKTVTVAGGGAGTYTTNASGNIQITNLNPGNSTAMVTIPGGWTATTSNPATAFYPPSPTQLNFGIQAPAPYCAGGLTANPSSVTAGSGVTSALTCVNPTSPNGDPVSYTWFSDGVGTVDNVNSATSTWRSPISTAATVTNPSVRICYQGTNRCGSSTTPITIIQRFTITGQVYVDENENRIKDVDESNYTGNVTITATPVNGSSSTDVNGAYTIDNLPTGSYTISYTNLPANYRINYPQNGPPPNFTVTVGNQANCTASIAGYNSAVCTNGSISNLNFGIITNAGPWIQSGGSDIWFNNGLTNPIPSGANCQSYASLAGPGGTPGIVYSGIGSADFGLGQASANPYNWKVGGISSYSESYGPASSKSPLATSYSYIKNLATTNGTPPTLLTTTHCGALGIASCNLSPTLASGVYEAVGNLTLANNYAFPANRNYVILVSGNLRLNGTIDVPVGSTVLFSVQGNIYVSPNVGTNNVNSTTPHLEGWFSTDHSFYVEGGNTCPARDNRLNMEGAIIVNASLQGGSFYNDRDLCSQNSNCPVFYIKERPDFTLNAPRFLKNAPRVYKEVAP